MKYTLLLCTLFAAAMLSSCSSEEPPIPFDYVSGEFKNLRVDLTYNGEKDPESRVRIGIDTAMNGSCAKLNMFMYDKAYIVMAGNPQFDKKTADYDAELVRFNPDAVSYSDRIVFEGVNTLYKEGDDVVEYTVKGCYTKAPIGKTPLELEVRSRVYKEGLTGRTFEMNFVDGAIDAGCKVWRDIPLNRTGMRPGELLEKFCGLLQENYVGKTGVDAIRFTFNDDGTVTVMAHDMASGSYIAQDAKSTYQVAADNRLFIIQDAEWSQKSLNLFSPYKSAGYSSSLPSGFYHSGMTFLSGKSQAVMSFNIEIEDETLSLTPFSGQWHNHRVSRQICNFLSSWNLLLIDTEPSSLWMWDLHTASENYMLDSNISFIARKVDR